ncbi:hypothetical protein MGSAQ_003177, partial [marine sediment metagenome]
TLLLLLAETVAVLLELLAADCEAAAILTVVFIFSGG